MPREHDLARTTAAAAIVLVALTVEVLLLARDSRLWLLVVVGAAAGAFAGGFRQGRYGLLVWLLVGGAVGLLSPLLYYPFWLVFTLPPHPTPDL
jgi:hypothetical protein